MGEKYTILKIHRWSGRLGNNIIQVKNALYIALHYKLNLIIPKHWFFKKTYFNLFDIESEIVDIPRIFFYRKKLEDDGFKDCFREEYEDKIKKILIENCSLTFENLPISGDNDLLIHIRSGDIFRSVFSDVYIPPPLSYYRKIIEENNYDNIYLISEDKANPCIEKLIKLYPKIKFKLKSLKEDINLVLYCKNIVMSIGTMIPSLVWFSKNCSTIYIPSYIKKPIFRSWREFTHYPKSIKEISIDCEAYKSNIDKWNLKYVPLLLKF